MRRAMRISSGAQSESRRRQDPRVVAHLGTVPDERKTVTVLFADVVGSTVMGSQRDPELVRDVLRRFFARMKGIAESHGGTVEKYIGDAVMVVFGLPRLHEYDAERAVRAAFAMRSETAELDAE